MDVVLICPPGLAFICHCLPAAVAFLWACDGGLLVCACARRPAAILDPPTPRLPPLPSVLSVSLIDGMGPTPPRRHSHPPLRLPPARLPPVASVAVPAQPAPQLPSSLASRTPHRAWGSSPSHYPPWSGRSGAADAGDLTSPLICTQQSFNIFEENGSSTLGDHFSL